MKEKEQAKSEKPSTKKKKYSSPQLVRHGRVEELTQLEINPTPSCPIPIISK